MKTVLIVQNDLELARLWGRHIERMGLSVLFAEDSMSAIDVISRQPITLIVLDLGLPGGDAMTVADYAGYRRPDARVVFVTASRFFSDGSLFNFSRNACAVLPSATQPEDLAVMVDHFGRTRGEDDTARDTAQPGT
jgi:CheY-like chemotaxis protein